MGRRQMQLALLAALGMWVIPHRVEAKPEVTSNLMLQGGRSYPQAELAEWLQPGPAYRLKVFGGAKVDVAAVGAVGLGLDLTYSQHQIKNSEGGRYRRWLWDWLFVPINIGFLNVTPGIAWVVTDVHVPEWDVKEVSIRPAGVLSVGARVGVHPNVALTADVRAEKVVIDQEPIGPEEKKNVTGEYVAAMAGIMGYF